MKVSRLPVEYGILVLAGQLLPILLYESIYEMKNNVLFTSYNIDWKHEIIYMIHYIC